MSTTKDYVSEWSKRFVEDVATEPAEDSPQHHKNQGFSRTQHEAMRRRLDCLQNEMKSIANSVRDAYGSRRISGRVWTQFGKLEKSIRDFRSQMDNQAYTEGHEDCYYRPCLINPRLTRVVEEKFGGVPEKHRGIKVFLYNVSRLTAPAFVHGHNVWFALPMMGEGWELSHFVIRAYSGDFDGNERFIPRIAANQDLAPIPLPKVIDEEWKKTLGVESWIQSKTDFELTCTQEELPYLAEYAVALFRALRDGRNRIDVYLDFIKEQSPSSYMWTPAAEEEYKAVCEARKSRRRKHVYEVID